MSEWMDLAVYAILVVTVWLWLPTWSSWFTIRVVADRNQEWLADHPEIARRLAGSRWFRRSCQLWGLLSLAALLAVQVGPWPPAVSFLQGTSRWEALKDLNSALLIAGLVYVAICTALFSRWLHTNVPLASRRQASLERRSVDDYIPRAAQHAVYGLVVLHAAAWVAVGVTIDTVPPAFWGTMMFHFVISGVFLLFVLRTIRRRPTAMDRIGGPDFRRTEVRVAFAAQLLPLLNGTSRLYEAAAEIKAEHLDRVLHLGLVLLIVGLAALPRGVSLEDRT